MTSDDPEECGDLYSLTAIKTDTRLFISRHEGGRSTEDAIALFSDVERRRSIDSPTPVFTSDDWDAFKKGLLYVYGCLVRPPYVGIGRKPNPVLVPGPHLKYAQLTNEKENGHVVGIDRRVVFGNPEEVLRILGADSGGKIHTSYVERLNLTIRNSLARFVRKTMNFSKKILMHVRTLDFFQAWYNFVKIHDSLKIEVNEENRRWMQRTPAMAEGLTDHIWTLMELLTFKVPIQ